MSILRILATFLRNRCRSGFSFSSARKFAVVALILCAVYGYVYHHSASVSSIRENAERYPGSMRNLASHVHVETVRVTVTPLQERASTIHTKPQRIDTHGLVSKETLPKVLVLYDQYCVTTAKSIQVILEAQRIPFATHRHIAGRKPILTVGRNGKSVGAFSVIIVADMSLSWAKSESGVYQDYCKEFGVPLVFISKLPDDNIVKSEQYVNHLRTYILTSDEVKYLEFNSSSTFYYAKPGVRVNKVPSGAFWRVFEPSHDSHVTQEQGHVRNVAAPKRKRKFRSKRQLLQDSHHSFQDKTPTFQDKIHSFQDNQLTIHSNFETLLSISYPGGPNSTLKSSPIVLKDKGLLDGVPKVFIGTPISYWVSKLLLLETIRSSSPRSVMRFGRRRWVMVDIDDIFVAPEGLKMTTADVRALLDAQERFRVLVPGFTFNLGFCGQYFDRGTEEEREGSKELVRTAGHFWWFGHTFNHYQPHTVSEVRLKDLLTRNVEFAKSHSLPASLTHYAVSPHHSGVYPVHPPLYTAWRDVWNVTMTTTEEYPHLRPDHMRRGFIHNSIMVVPRQTCRLFTHTTQFTFFPGGREELVSLAEGGEVFDTLLHNPVSIFMTHVTNYATDRLSLVMFEALFSFVRRYTQLELITDRPLTLGRKYFEIFPEDKMPVWTSPCADKRHLEIWPKGKNCSRLPSLLILGPQKSGTTALHSFLKLHPDIVSNFQTRDHFEEVQFFSNDTLYQQGIDWYMDSFPYPRSPNQLLFEKSATYFTHPLAPLRAHTLLPKANLIVILHDPIKRAYSWYQHMRAHSDPTALRYSFSEVVRAPGNASSERRLLLLSNHCLGPGAYHEHITQWMEHYPAHQLLFIDGDQLVEKPAVVMETVQQFLRVKQINYHQMLRYDERKGFYCATARGGKTQCLGAGKGRRYPPMLGTDREFLEKHYSTANTKLTTLLRELSSPLPAWLVRVTGQA